MLAVHCHSELVTVDRTLENLSGGQRLAAREEMATLAGNYVSDMVRADHQRDVINVESGSEPGNGTGPDPGCCAVADALPEVCDSQLIWAVSPDPTMEQSRCVISPSGAVTRSVRRTMNSVGADETC